MKPPPIPPNEARRLRALHRYRLLDTAPETSFDDLVRIAAYVLETPIALVSLVAADRQWFKARYGLEAPETSRTLSFCAHAISDGEPLVVHNALEDPRFADNPLVTGDPHVIFYAGAPLVTPDGYALGTLCVIDHRPRDITPAQAGVLEALGRQTVALMEFRRERHASQQREGMLDASPSLGGVFTIAGVPIHINDNWIARLGYDPRTEDLTLFDMLEPESVALFRAALHDIVTNDRPGAIDARVRCRDTRECCVVLAIAPDSVEDRLYVCGVDITDKVRLREMQNGFVSIVSHELRTPLTSINGSLSLLAGGVMGTLPDEASALVQVARGNCDRLIRLVNDILDVERMRAGSMVLTLAPCALAALLRQAVREVEGFAVTCDVTVELGTLDEASVNIDRDRILQAVTNLLSNAIKFSPARGRVTVRAARARTHVRVEVQDRGKGLGPEDRRRIFERFVQVDSGDDRAHSGTGLGLHITRAIIDGHGGEVGVESVPGEGSTFWLEIPICDS